MATTRKFKATYGLDNNNQQIDNIGAAGAHLTRAGAHLLTLTTSGTTNVTFPTSGTLVGSADTGTVTSTMIANGTIVNEDISASAAIAITKLAASTISGVSLGNNLSNLTAGTGLSGGPYNGSSAVTLSVASTLDSNARVAVEKNGSLVGTRRAINFIEGTGITLTIADDSANEEVDVTINSSASANSFATISVSGQSDVVADAASDTLTLAAGTGITLTTNATTDTITIASTASTNSFSTISVSGQSDVVADSASDTLTLVAGSNVTITTNAGSDAITINATQPSIPNNFGTIAVPSGTNPVADTTSDTLTLAAGTGITITGDSSTDTVTIATTGLAPLASPTFTGTVTIPDLIVNGTTTTINSTTVTLDDPIITLGGDTAPSTDDNKDRGVEFRWHNGSGARVGFFGFDDSTGKFTFIPEATNTSEVFSGTLGTIDVGAVHISGSQIAASNLSNGVTGTGKVVLETSPTFLTKIVTPQVETTNSLVGSATITTTNTSQTFVNLCASTYRSVKINVSATDATGSKFESVELLAVRDNTATPVVFLTEYGYVSNGTSPVASLYDVDVSGGNIRFGVTSATTNSSVYKVHFTAV